MLHHQSVGRIAVTLMEKYLGRGIDAVPWYSDLRGYTRITDTAEPDQIMPLLNDYADLEIPAIHDAGGDASGQFIRHDNRRHISILESYRRGDHSVGTGK